MSRPSRRFAVVRERVEEALDQVRAAATGSTPGRLKSVLAYWFGTVYDEGQRDAGEPLSSTVDRLRTMNRRLSDQLRDGQEGPED